MLKAGVGGALGASVWKAFGESVCVTESSIGHDDGRLLGETVCVAFGRPVTLFGDSESGTAVNLVAAKDGASVGGDVASQNLHSGPSLAQLETHGPFP